MNDRNRKVKLNKKSMVMIGVAFLIVLAVAALMYYMDHRSTGTSEGSGKKVYTIDGEECYKKQNIETYLFLGVDAAGDSRNTKQKKNQSVQCDSVILLVIDRVNKNFAILPLDRDAMVSLEIPDEDGNILGENTMQLALAYAYGDGKEQTCELAEDEVSGLLHDQRIDGYVSLSMDAIGAVNHLVGGVDVKDYSLDVLRREVSMVLQKNVLFSGTILDNLRWGDENASEEECIRVAKLACADEFIERFPDKYNTWIEQGGSNVSGGQKQRLTIARALLRKPKVLILDDSTSAVDTATDAKIRKAFREEIPGTTKIIIAQRISSVQDADRILVLDNGQINGLGTHEELLKTNKI